MNRDQRLLAVLHPGQVLQSQLHQPRGGESPTHRRAVEDRTRLAALLDRYKIGLGQDRRTAAFGLHFAAGVTCGAFAGASSRLA